jgi:hypothetical protein
MPGTLPGAVHDKRAGWIWGVLEAVGLVTVCQTPLKAVD